MSTITGTCIDAGKNKVRTGLMAATETILNRSDSTASYALRSVSLIMRDVRSFGKGQSVSPSNPLIHRHRPKSLPPWQRNS